MKAIIWRIVFIGAVEFACWANYYATVLEIRSEREIRERIEALEKARKQ